MTRIVRTAYRYKRPPRRKKAAALEMPAVGEAAEPAKARKRASLPTAGKTKSEAANGDPKLLSRVANFPAPVSSTGTTLTDRKPTERPPAAASAIITIRSRKHAMLAHLLEDMTPEEHRRRGDAADALFRDIVRRIGQPT
jgi:hypothetical protein